MVSAPCRPEVVRGSPRRTAPARTAPRGMRAFEYGGLGGIASPYRVHARQATTRVGRTYVRLHLAATLRRLAPVAQWIEHWFPEQGPQVRILPGAPRRCRRGAGQSRGSTQVPGCARRVEERELDRDLVAGRPCPVVDLEPVVAGSEVVDRDRLTVQIATVGTGARVRPGPVVVAPLEVEVEVRRQGRRRTTPHRSVVVDGIDVELEVLARHAVDALADARCLGDHRPLDRRLCRTGGDDAAAAVSPFCCGGSVKESDFELCNRLRRHRHGLGQIALQLYARVALDRLSCAGAQEGQRHRPAVDRDGLLVGAASAQKSVLLSVTLTPIRCPAGIFQSADQRSSGILPLP